MHNTSAMASVKKTSNAILGKSSFTTNGSQSKSGTLTSRTSKEGESVSDAEAKRKHACAQDHTMSSENLDSSPLVFDKLHRTYYNIVPHTGPVVITLRASKFYSFTSQTHAIDLLPIFKAVVAEGRTAVLVIADGGPDWSTGSLLNTVEYRYKEH